MYGRTQQKSCQAVPVVLERWSVSLESHSGADRVWIQGRNARIEMERAARALAQLRLPVVHQVVDKVEAEADFVSAFHPACVGVEGIGLVVAEERGSSFPDCPERHNRRCKKRACRFPRVGAVGPRNPQHVRTEIGAEVRGLTFWPNRVQPNVASIRKLGETV